MSESQREPIRRLPPRKKVEIRLTAVQAEKLRGLWQEHSGALHAMLVGWCGDPQNAADVLQEVFRRLAASPALMAKMKNTRAFLAVSARRIAVDFARRSTTRAAYHIAAGGEIPSSENPGPTDEALRVAIRRALESLPAEQRTVFEHKVLKGRTLEEISKLENISLNTAASRLRYAIDKIRGQLRLYYDDLNRKDFKIMKNDPSKTEDIASKRIITPLAPKRVPSVAPGLEGLAAMAPDACEAAPEVAVYESDYVEAAPAVEVVEPEIAFCGVGGNAWEANIPEAVELPVVDAEGSVSEGAEEAAEFVVSEEMPEIISCEILPECGIPEEWLRPIACELPEDFFVTVFEGESENSADGVVDGEFGEGEALPFGIEEGFEICVLPVPEEFSSSFDPQELLVRYEEFLREDPNWFAGLAENQGDWFHEQVTTASAYFEKLEFGTPGEANAFDHWFASNFGAAADGTSQEGTDHGNEQPDYSDGSWSFDPKDLLVRYEDFLRENPDWGALDPDMMEIQVVTPSGYFGALEFGTPSKAAAFDSWYETNYAQGDFSGVGSIDGSGLVLDGSSNFDGGTVVTGGEIVVGSRPDGSGLTSGSGLVLNGGGSFAGGTIISGGNVYSEDKAFSLETTGTITDVRNGLTGIPAEWMRGGTVNTGGLVLSGGADLAGTTTVAGGEIVSPVRPVEGAGPISAPGLSLNDTSTNTGGLPDRGNPAGGFPGSTVVTGGEVAIDPELYQLRYDSFLAANPGWVNQNAGNGAAYDRWFDITYGGGQATPAESEALLRVYTSEFAGGSNSESTFAGARSPDSDIELNPDLQQLPVEVSEVVTNLTAFGAVEPSLVSGGVSPEQIQIIEFSVLSPSEPIQSQPDILVSKTTAGVQLSERSENGFEAVEPHFALASTQAVGPDAFFAGAPAQEQEQDSTLSPSYKEVDTPTAAAGAAAAGAVVHAGAVTPAVRRPLPPI